jgi:hypothetical protein
MVSFAKGTLPLFKNSAPLLHISYLVQRSRVGSSVAGPHPDPYVFGPPGSVSYKYGSGSRSFNHQAKIVRKPVISTVFRLEVYRSEDPHPHPDPYQNFTDPQHWWERGEHKVHIYKEYHSVCPLVEIGTLPTIL